jgi:general secretion pathway protein D
MLERLDSLPNQVMIEATIAEVTLTDELKYGLRWFFQNAESTFTFSDVSSGAVAQSFPGFSYLFADTDARVALNAISSITNVNVISSPTLFVMDNRTAELQVGDQVPVATQSAVSITTPDAPVVNTISFRDTGVILRITPRVNESGVVILDLDQEVSNVAATTTSGIDSPTIQQRRVHTTVAVQDGDSVALGGLIQDNININSSGVPFVSKIPLIGEAFKSKRNTKQRTELLILITPRIARNRAESAQVTEEFRSRLRSIELERTHGERP